jgi:hypothetical protein
MLSIEVLLRIARCLYAIWEAPQRQDHEPEAAYLDCLQREYVALSTASARLVKARQHRLSLILPTLERDLFTHARELGRAAENLLARRQRAGRKLPAIASVVADLRQVEEEFGGLDIHWKQKAISVTTKPITLEGIELGPFAIKLYWERGPEDDVSGCFQIIALEPNPAASDDSVTHPHVKDEYLCAGQAARALCKALEEKRLADAFCIVHSVLTTYNRESPHVALHAWGGQACHDCGERVRTPDVWVCDKCGEEVCPECINRCTSCRTARCANCCTRCAVCKEPVCDECVRCSAHSTRMCCWACTGSCLRCQRLIAKDEIHSPQDCPAYTKIDHTNPTETPDEIKTPPAATAS